MASDEEYQGDFISSIIRVVVIVVLNKGDLNLALDVR